MDKTAVGVLEHSVAADDSVAAGVLASLLVDRVPAAEIAPDSVGQTDGDVAGLLHDAVVDRDILDLLVNTTDSVWSPVGSRDSIEGVELAGEDGEELVEGGVDSGETPHKDAAIPAEVAALVEGDSHLHIRFLGESLDGVDTVADLVAHLDIAEASIWAEGADADSEEDLVGGGVVASLRDARDKDVVVDNKVVGRGSNHDSVLTFLPDKSSGVGYARRGVALERFEEKVFSGDIGELTFSYLGVVGESDDDDAVWGADTSESVVGQLEHSLAEASEVHKLLRHTDLAEGPEARAGAAGHYDAIYIIVHI